MTAQYPMLLNEAEREIILQVRAAARLRISIRDMIRQASDQTGIPMDELMGPSHRAELCRIRELIYAAARRQGYSLPQIGRVFRRDHTTILSGLRNYEAKHGAAHA